MVGYTRFQGSGLGRDAHNHRNHNQAIDSDSYKITAPDSD